MLSYISKNKPHLDLIYWARLKNGDPDALGYFYDNYVDQLFQAALRITDKREIAKDALQEVFIQLWNYRETLAEVNNTQSYLLKVLRNILIKKLKKEYPVCYTLFEDSMEGLQENIEDVIIAIDTQKEFAGKLQRAISNLTDRQKTILQLHFYEGLNYKQIAEKLRMNQQSVNNLVFRTMMRLRSQLHQVMLLVYLICEQN